ncbi:uncharacterized protein LOC134187081 [Corticium candelabrum]|uniref:uncharacterized protein LOC134187081 n=1 Tax=Corticium candelabrum TaxID=121492 RepID=UPI002E261EED|nr:uncharacterized protein LOC134187081 [Corticium candelabrum]
MTEELMRDRLVCGVHEDSLRKQLLAKTELPLTECIDLCRAHESTTKQAKDMAGGESIRVVKKMLKGSKERKPLSTRGESECANCGLQHSSKKAECPAADKECRDCGAVGHFSRKCRKKARRDKKSYSYRKGRICHVEEVSTDSDDQEEQVMTICIT